jgi:hypothetical protein
VFSFKHEKYGMVVIYDPDDTPWRHRHYEKGKLDIDHFRVGSRKEIFAANIVGFRSLEDSYVEIIKNRYGPSKELSIKNFILTYGQKEEIFDPIDSRFEILDI